MKRQTFRCDYCDKSIECPMDPFLFPYKDGWVYLYNLNFKTSELPYKQVAGQHKEFRDHHFCCREHLLKFVMSRINPEVKPNA